MTGRGLILAELERVAKGACRLLRLLRSGESSADPADQSRPLQEAANLLAQSLLSDQRLLLGASQEELDELVDSLWSEDPERWCALLREGCERLRAYMEGLSLENYENGSVTAFYGRTQTNAAWLLEIYTRLVHRRALVYGLMRQTGYSVDGRVFEG